ncbi:MAG: ATP-binding protein [Candidatus Thorarchaeota archaeon]|nr:hypothetical protein [Thermoplasmatales archaeon]
MSDFFRASLLEQEAINLRFRLIKGCKRCGGKGRLATKDYDRETLSYKTFPCWCTRRYIYLLDLLIAGVKEQQAIEIVTKAAEECWVTEIDLANGKEKDSTKLYKEHLGTYVKNLDKVIENGYSYLFVGINSTGKTFAALKVLHHFLKMGKSGHYIKFRKLMKLINRAIAGGKQERQIADRLLDEILKVDFLVIDELGRETGNREHIASEIDEILKDRDMASSPTFVVTNRDFEDVEDLYEGGNSAIVSAFMRSYRLLIFDPDNDFRKTSREQEWFD